MIKSDPAVSRGCMSFGHIPQNTPLSYDLFLDAADLFAKTIIDEQKQKKSNPISGVIALYGDLGAGKTTFARHFIQSALNDPDLIVPSPTFTLVQPYTNPDPLNPFSIIHADLYRFHEPEECIELGLLERMHDSICLIEWPQHLGPYLPKNRINVKITIQNNDRLLLIEDNRCTP